MSRAIAKLLCLLILLLNACSSRQFVGSVPPELILLPPAEASVELLLKQTLTFVTEDKQQQFLLIARIEHQRLRLVVLLPAGQQLLALDYDGKNLQQENRSTLDIPGKDILASMQFALWPEASLRQHYASSEGWRIEITDGERRLLTSSKLLLKIVRDTDALVVDNYLQDYRVIIQTLEKKEL